jgi:Hypothetical glycosyl hydrolase 6/Beta-galactosidase trimerisation domain
MRNALDRRTFSKLLAGIITAAGIPLSNALETFHVTTGHGNAALKNRELPVEAKQNKPWEERPVTGIGTNIWAPEWLPESITKWDPDKLADSLVRARVQVAFTFQGFTQDHFGISYYPTRMGPMHRNLNDRDHIREYLDAVHKRNIKLFGYYSFPDASVWAKNPDWRQVTADGQEIHAGNFGGPLCPNSPYRDYLIARLSEIVTNYDLDGFLMDTAGFLANGCYCAYCQRKYRDRYGTELPREHAGYTKPWQQFQQFRSDSMHEFYRDEHDIVKSIRPRMLFTHNAFALNGPAWASGEDYQSSTALDDIVTSIGTWGGGGASGPARYPSEIWKAGMLTRFFRGISGKPVWLQIGAYVYDRDYQALPEHELELAAASIVGNGGSPIYIINAFPDATPDELVTDRVAEALQAFSGRLEYLEGAEDLRFAALYYSGDSHLLSDSVSQDGSYLSSFEGAYKALMEEHIPFDIIGNEGLSAERLAEYKILVVADAVAMSGKEAEILRKFVQTGGSLVATSRTSLLESDGTPRNSFALAELFGADYENPLNYESSFIKPLDNHICKGIDLREQIPFRHGQQVKVLIRPGAQLEANLVMPATEVVPSVRTFDYTTDVAPGRATAYPAILTNKFGKGRVVYFAGDITSSYGRFGDSSLRKLLRNAIAWACNDSLPLEVEAPLALEVRCFRNGQLYVVTMTNYITSDLRLSPNVGGPTAEDTIPIHDISIRLRTDKPPTRVFLASTKTQIPFSLQNGIVSVQIPKVDTFDILVVSL